MKCEFYFVFLHRQLRVIVNIEIMASEMENMTSGAYPAEFADIAPFSDSEFREAVLRLAKEPGFEHALSYVLPEGEYPRFRDAMLGFDTIYGFQHKLAWRFLEMLASKTTSGVSYSGLAELDTSVSRLYITNHRDIVLDAAFLNLCMIREHKPITQIAIGNNLLIYEWIRDLVRINRSVIVKRDVKPLQALAAARQLSSYIHYLIEERHESMWIAQREGRAKDSSDTTQESLLKMLTLGCDCTPCEGLKRLNIVPVSISYEYDPNDYLKVREFVLRKRDPEYRKSRRDDLFSMETGILQFKGRVHFTFNNPINDKLKDCTATDRNTVVKDVRNVIDTEIHAGYRLFPINYVAYDLLLKTDRFADSYDASQKEEAENYLRGQAAKLDIEDITADELEYARQMFLKMYANPLINKIDARHED